MEWWELRLECGVDGVGGQRSTIRWPWIIHQLKYLLARDRLRGHSAQTKLESLSILLVFSLHLQNQSGFSTYVAWVSNSQWTVSSCRSQASSSHFIYCTYIYLRAWHGLYLTSRPIPMFTFLAAFFVLLACGNRPLCLRVNISTSDMTQKNPCLHRYTYPGEPTVSQIRHSVAWVW